MAESVAIAVKGLRLYSCSRGELIWGWMGHFAYFRHTLHKRAIRDPLPMGMMTMDADADEDADYGGW